ncbi:O-antigen ligase family protein [Sphingomonas naphthae]|uniref:O-antigen ligase family protein n=1 Tax=Sphingomonas naphthae TaxID=1813468 RepID=A0ABY7TKD9_9SPHN|nr:O-antigen ligase family protein [Sphingomonas naphthae]WCT73698.1 O-antigen ligase family protein [Sphingomonas naphthae]
MNLLLRQAAIGRVQQQGRGGIIRLSPADVWIYLTPLCLFANLLLWQSFYILYAIILLAIIAIKGVKFRWDVIPWIMVVKVAFLALSILAHSESTKTIINACSIMLADITCLALIVVTPSDPASMSKIFRKIYTVFLVIMGIGFAIGMVAPGAFQVVSLSSVASGGRLLLFAGEMAGHSAAYDLSLVLLILSIAGFSGRSTNSSLAIAVVCLVVAMLTRASTTYGALIGIGYVYLVEMVLPLRWRSRNVVHAFVAVGAIALFSTVSVTDLLSPLRDFQRDGEVVAGEDLTAGRSGLTDAYLSLANSAPTFGVGRDHPLFLIGLLDENYNVIAAVETPIRLAAGFGWPYFAIILGILFSLLKCLRFPSRRKRFLCLSLLMILLSMFVSGSLFEIAHYLPTYFYVPLIFLISSSAFLREPKRPRA